MPRFTLWLPIHVSPQELAEVIIGGAKWETSFQIWPPRTSSESCAVTFKMDENATNISIGHEDNPDLSESIDSLASMLGIPKPISGWTEVNFSLRVDADHKYVFQATSILLQKYTDDCILTEQNDTTPILMRSRGVVTIYELYNWEDHTIKLLGVPVERVEVPEGLIEFLGL